MCDILKIIHFAKSKACDLKMNCLLNSAIHPGYAINHDAQDILVFKKLMGVKRKDLNAKPYTSRAFSPICCKW